MKLVWNCPNINATSHTTTCKGEESHKETESYSYHFTDCVHKAFNRAAQSARTFACAVIALSDPFARSSTTMASFSVPPHVEEAPEYRLTMYTSVCCSGRSASLPFVARVWLASSPTGTRGGQQDRVRPGAHWRRHRRSCQQGRQ